jgi:hypothetical protein
MIWLLNRAIDLRVPSLLLIIYKRQALPSRGTACTGRPLLACIGVGGRMTKRNQRPGASHARELDPFIAIHEAGHAVARYITAKDMGFPVEASITHIEISPGTLLGRSSDCGVCLVSQAVTFGPMFSAEINELVGANTDLADIASLVAAAVANGFDVSTWLEARALITVFGPMAEAVARKKPFRQVWESYACEADARSFARDCFIGGLPPSELDSLFNKAVKRAAAMVRRPEILAALTALAGALPNAGTMDGKDAAAIIGRAMVS